MLCIFNIIHIIVSNDMLSLGSFFEEPMDVFQNIKLIVRVLYMIIMFYLVWAFVLFTVVTIAFKISVGWRLLGTSQSARLRSFHIFHEGSPLFKLRPFALRALLFIFWLLVIYGISLLSIIRVIVLLFGGFLFIVIAVMLFAAIIIFLVMLFFMVIIILWAYSVFTPKSFYLL